MLERPRVFFATVFNGERIDGPPSLQPKQEQTWDAIERAEQILKASSGARITHASGDQVLPPFDRQHHDANAASSPAPTATTRPRCTSWATGLATRRAWPVTWRTRSAARATPRKSCAPRSLP